MSIPMPQSMDQEPVTWTLAHTTGRESLAGARGFVRFEPTAHAVAFPSMTVLPRPVEARVVAGVMEPVDLMVNDPELWNWRVTPEVGVPWGPFHVDVLGPVDIAAVAVVPGKGPIRAVTGPPGTTAWADLTGKPATYPSTIPEVDGLQAALDELITLDTSAGTRVFARGVMLHGDTGWRRIDQDLLNGWGSLTELGAIYNPAIRRIGPMVYFRYRSLSADNATNEQFYIAPSGFRPPASTSDTAWFGTQKRVMIDASGGMSINGLPTSPGEAGEMQWMTTQAWPTSLPGTPA